MSQTRIIKKYPNRRLYDTETSRYITLEGVRKLVIQNETFIVQDARSKRDLTRNILLQIIMEQEEDGEPIFNEQILAQIIRLYGDAMQSTFTDYMQNSFDTFLQNQNQIRANMEDVLINDPLNVIRDLTAKNLEMWKNLQSTMFKEDKENDK